MHAQTVYTDVRVQSAERVAHIYRSKRCRHANAAAHARPRRYRRHRRLRLTCRRFRQISCAATCKLLRLEILSPAFIHGVGVGVLPKLVGFLGGSSSTFSLAYPETPAARSFAENDFAPFVDRSAAGLLKEYKVVTTRGGLAVLERRAINGRRRSERRSDLCVYDPMTGDRAFFPFPPDISRDPLIGAVYTYVVVTAADGAAIGCPFLLLAADMTSLRDSGTMVGVQTVSPSPDAGGGQWGPRKFVSHRGQGVCLADTSNSAVVLRGVVHWLMRSGDEDSVFTYDVVTGGAGTVVLSAGLRRPAGRHSLEAKLGASPDGRLTLAVAKEMSVSLWVQQADGNGSRRGPDWERRAVVDTEAAIRSALDPAGGGHRIGIRGGVVTLVNCGDQRSGAVFLRVVVENGLCSGRTELMVLDVGTGEIRRVSEWDWWGLLYEVDLASRLSAMKTF